MENLKKFKCSECGTNISFEQLRDFGICKKCHDFETLRGNRKWQRNNLVHKIFHMGMKQYYVFYFCETCYEKNFIEKLVRRLK